MLDGLVNLVLALPVLGAAGGGSGGYGGGGGGGYSGGGGGYSGGGGSGSGSGDLGGLEIVLLVLAVIVFMTASAISAKVAGRKLRKRRERVRTAAAEAAEDDPDFAATVVEREAANLFRTIQDLWTKRDRGGLSRLVGEDLAREWVRRLDDFERKGWQNVVRVKGGPTVRYVGLVNREDDTDDRVVVRVEASLEDYVRVTGGGMLLADGASSQMRSLDEYWTLGKRGDAWILLSIEQPEEGKHHLDSEIVTTPWADVKRLRDEALVEGAVADKVAPGFEVTDVADLDFDGDARAAALDLSLADGRFAPDVLETAARRAVAGWAEAIDGDDSALESVASPAAVAALLHPGDPSGRTRLVVRGPQIRRVRIAALDAAAKPPTMTIDVEVTGTRYVQDRDTADVVAGSDASAADFTERWTMALDGPDEQPWRIAGVAGAVA
ncbi:MAG TPA: TIM44-like domain-containing protein [Thermoleophilaceae bacterium]|nr:TIM44-like domain-containing protein [Thermoleophilaceae bacterium]